MNPRGSKSRNGKAIPPPPPGTEKGYDALIEYLNRYSTEELEKAGYLEEAPPEAMRELQLAAAYELLRSNGLRVRLSRKDCERLVRLAVADKVSVDDLVKRWLKDRMRLEGRRPVKTKTSGNRA